MIALLIRFLLWIQGRVWQFQNDQWNNFPGDDEAATIHHASGLVLSVGDDDLVFLDLCIEADHQFWQKGPEDNEGYFTLQNYDTGKYLTAAGLSTTLVADHRSVFDPEFYED